MSTLGTALRPAATRVMLLGSGELGKEVAIECQRLGVEVIAVDRYANAPAMHVAHRSHVINMLDAAALKALVAAEMPDPPNWAYSHAFASCSAVRMKLWPLPEELITGLTMHGKPISCTAWRKASSLSAKR